MTDDPIERWRAEVAATAIPRSARTYALGTLLERLRSALREGLEPGELAARLEPGPGTARDDRSLRVLRRTGHLRHAVVAYEQAFRRRRG